MKPLLYGYQQVRVGMSRHAAQQARRSLVEFAAREGYSLGLVFEENDVNRPCSALVALIEAARRNGVRVVAVPAHADLGSLPRVQQLTRQMLERQAGVRVVVARESR